MNLKQLSTLFVITLFIYTSCINTKNASKTRENNTPNIVIIYADDMGYGDLSCQNSNSKIPTPNLDKLAAEGMRFTDAHSSSGICSPSRYALLTGKYHWRKQHNIVNSFGKPFFNDNDITLPQVLKTKGYKTACIGKWHLGWKWPTKNPPSRELLTKKKKKIKIYQSKDIDWTKPIEQGPLSKGFDYYFGDGTINFPPYAWIENKHVTEIPTEEMDPKNVGKNTKEGKWEFRPGPKVKGWNPYEVLPTLTKKTVNWIKEQDNNNPFFLYFALPSPHAPIIPNNEFDGTSKAGAYGDYMYQTDWIVGQVTKALKEKNLDKNTIVIFSSDNGPENYAWERSLKYNHSSMGNFRGLKRDVWEGGHHVPFIVKWPNKIVPNSISNQVICQTDIMATLANITKASLPENAANDSYDFTDILKGKNYNKPLREATIHNTFKDVWGVRQGDWLYINHSTGGHKKPPISYRKKKGYKNFNTKKLLFNLAKDPEQLNNLYNNYTLKASKMDSLLQNYKTVKSTVK